MNILAIDTSTKLLCVGLVNHKGKSVEYSLDSTMKYDQLLLPTISKALKRLKLCFKQIDCFVVGLGPGSFTGLRIALSTVKAFAVAQNKPIAGISSLDIIASNALKQNSGIICPVIDARRGLVFTALFQAQAGRIKRNTRYLLISPEELLMRLRGKGRVAFLGDGLELYEQDLKRKIKNALFLDKDAWYPKAENIIKLASDVVKKGRFSQISKIKPIYLYPKECQIRK